MKCVCGDCQQDAIKKLSGKRKDGSDFVIPVCARHDQAYEKLKEALPIWKRAYDNKITTQEIFDKILEAISKEAEADSRKGKWVKELILAFKKERGE